VDKHFETSGAKSSGNGRVACLYLGKDKNNDDLLNAFKSLKEKMKLKNAAE
jgi:hypothetical protein